MEIQIFFLILFCVNVIRAVPITSTEAPEKGKCGYESCLPLKEGLINVHLVPHTHDDVGWLKTFDQYYYGLNNSIQLASVQTILDSVVDALEKDANRRFIYVETSYFHKWWMKQHDIVKAKVRRFVRNGQLEFVSGGWVMNDEACTHYQSTIDQFTWGLRFLNETFGECGRPKVGWQIDPFGHSREQASISAQLGFDGLLLGRIDYQDKDARLSSKKMEMVWKSSQNLENSDLFTGAMYNTYAAPKGFCFDILCSDEPIVDDKKSESYNVERRVDEFFAQLDNITKAYPTDNVILTMGEDFHFQAANMWYTNLDKLILYANKRQENGSKYNLLYSTPSCYVKAVHDQKPVLETKSDDFFPYASDPDAFWTGYFTSRPTIKRLERVGNNFLQVCKQLHALTDLGPEDVIDLNALRGAMGVMQHHDAVTGTEKEHVAHDYVKMLSKAFDECEIITNVALNKLTSSSDAKQEFSSCFLTNISSCAVSETSKQFIVTVYNPLSRPVSKHVRFPVLGQAYNIKDSEGANITLHLIPIAEPIMKVPGRKSEATNDLFFIASDIPPLGFKTYYITRTTGNQILVDAKDGASANLGTDEVSFALNPTTGFLSEVTINGVTVPIEQEMLTYSGMIGNNQVAKNRSSGAYIFRPNGTIPESVTDKAEIKIYRGELVSEVHQTFNSWISQIIRVFNNENYIELEWMVGPIPETDYAGKEVITKFKTNLNTSGTFYTDSNGREMLKRVKNFRPSWKLEVTEPVAGNYYPITSKILIRDEAKNVEVAVLNDRSQGGSSINDGEIEIMVHRNSKHDDAFGVGEPLNEQAYGAGVVAKGSHYLTVGPITSTTEKETIAAKERDIAQRKILDAWTFFAPTELSFEDYKSKFQMKYTGLKNALPQNVQILTLEPWIGFSFLLRLEHVLEKNEDPNLSKPVSINIQDLFTPFKIKSLKETTLGGNQWLKDSERLKFETAEFTETVFDINSRDNEVRSIKHKRHVTVNVTDDFDVTLTRMQIRTFVIEIQK